MDTSKTNFSIEVVKKPPSYILQTDSITFKSFFLYGVLCRKRNDGSHVINVEQKIWLDQSEAMMWGADSGVSGKNLAINILHHMMPGEDIKVASGLVSRNVFALYESFALEIIYSMPDAGGRIPLDQIENWIMRKLTSV